MLVTWSGTAFINLLPIVRETHPSWFGPSLPGSISTKWKMTWSVVLPVRGHAMQIEIGGDEELEEWIHGIALLGEAFQARDKATVTWALQSDVPEIVADTLNAYSLQRVQCLKGFRASRASIPDVP